VTAPLDPELSAPEFEPGPPPTQDEQQAFVEGRPPQREDVRHDESPVEFDPQWRDPFVGLLYIGRLRSTFRWLGHKFVIRTLKTDELIDIALVTKKYQGTEADLKAYQAAVTAACVESLDDRPLPFPDIIKADSSAQSLERKFNWVVENLFPPVLDVVYDEYIQLEYQVQEIIKAMTEATGSPPGGASG
jgi:hypothetical protein